jgi:phosphatidylserine/phosphatidylglycerophosphate/cardiolipin synthase-like enzyme
MRDYFTFLFYLDKAKSVTYNNIRYDSFAPVRSRNSVNLYIDGKDYFHDLAKSIETAQHEIFICGWWLSPEFHLIRPCTAEN